MPDAARRPRHWRYTVLGTALAALILLSTLEAVNVLAGPNTHEVIPGLVYRTSQPSPARLDRLIRTHGIRTVVNFRGVCEDVAWYQGECRVAASHGVSLEDFNGCSSGRLPSVHLIRELIRILDDGRYPILFHCNRGVDRTGLASVLTLLLKTDTPLPVALRQLGLRYGHLRWGRTGNIDRFFVLYQEWLDAHEKSHDRDVFRYWATKEYSAGEGNAWIELVEQPGRLSAAHASSSQYLEPITPNVYPPEFTYGPRLRLTANTAHGVRVRCHNKSAKPWRFQPGLNAGIHALFFVDDERGRNLTEGRSGLFDAVVPVGDSIDLTLGIPALPAGRYLLRVDMTDEQHAHFLQLGSRQLFVTLEVR